MNAILCTLHFSKNILRSVRFYSSYSCSCLYITAVNHSIYMIMVSYMLPLRASDSIEDACGTMRFD